MGSLKTFIVREELQVSHAERYLTYIERYHSEVLLDLKHLLEKRWAAVVARLSREYSLTEEEKQSALLQNPKATLEIELEAHPVKLLSTRVKHPQEVAPSVKVPNLLKQEERDLIVRELLRSGKQALDDTVSSWGEIFNYEKKGKLNPWFRVVQERDELRLQLAASHADAHSYRTLYSIHVEYGRTKLRDYLRVYLTSSV